MSSNSEETARDTAKGRPSGASRSPNYPQMNINQAVDRIKKVYAEEHTHSVPDQSIAAALGYTSLNGTSKVVLSSLKKYGLLIASGDGFKVSQDAIAILELPIDDPTRIVAIHRSALRPPIFKQLYEKYGDDLPSDASLRHYLISVGFESDAANQVIRHFKDTLRFMTAQGNVQEELPKTNQEEPPVRRTAEANNSTLSADTRVSTSQTGSTGEAGAASIASQLRFQVSHDCFAEVSFTSQITQGAITKLIDYLKLSMDLYPATAIALVPSVEAGTGRANFTNKGFDDENFIDADLRE